MRRSSIHMMMPGMYMSAMFMCMMCHGQNFRVRTADLG